MNNLNNGSWALTEEWLIATVETVAHQAAKRITTTSIHKEDLRQDLFLEVVRDIGFLPSLRSCENEAQASKVTYGFLDKTRKRLCRRYRLEWPKVKQIRIFRHND
jgi:hypothetical protein